MQTCTFFSTNLFLSLYEVDELKNLNVGLTDLHRKEGGTGLERLVAG